MGSKQLLDKVDPSNRIARDKSAMEERLHVSRWTINTNLLDTHRVPTVSGDWMLLYSLGILLNKRFLCDNVQLIHCSLHVLNSMDKFMRSI